MVTVLPRRHLTLRIRFCWTSSLIGSWIIVIIHELKIGQHCQPAGVSPDNFIGWKRPSPIKGMIAVKSSRYTAGGCRGCTTAVVALTLTAGVASGLHAVQQHRGAVEVDHLRVRAAAPRTWASLPTAVMRPSATATASADGQILQTQAITGALVKTVLVMTGSPRSAHCRRQHSF